MNRQRPVTRGIDHNRLFADPDMAFEAVADKEHGVDQANYDAGPRSN